MAERVLRWEEWYSRGYCLSVLVHFCSFTPEPHRNFSIAVSSSIPPDIMPQAPSLIPTNSLCHEWKGYTYFLTTSLFKWWLRDEMSWPVKKASSGWWAMRVSFLSRDHRTLLPPEPFGLTRNLHSYIQKKLMNFSNSSSIIAMLYDSYILQCISSTKCKLFYLISYSLPTLSLW